MSKRTPKVEKDNARAAASEPAQAAASASENASAAEKARKPRLTPKQKKWLIAGIALLVAAAVAVTAVVLHKKHRGGDEGLGVEVVTVAKQDMSQSISVTGKVASSKTMSVTSDLTAKVKTLNVELGDHVKKGDVLLAFDISDLDEQIKTLEQQTSRAAKAKAREKEKLQRALDQAVADGNEAVKDAAAEADKAYQAWAKLAADPEAEAEEVDAAKDAYYAAEKAVNAAVKEGNANVNAAQEAIEDADYASNDDDNDTAKELAKLYRQRNNATIKAEQDGIVTQLNTSVGSTPEGTLMRIEDDTALTIQVGVKAKDIVRLEKGMRAELTSDAYPDQTFSGTVTKVVNFTSSEAGSDGEEGGDSGDGYRANITIDEGDGLLLGMGVKVKIYLQEGEEAMAVPYDSIIEEDGTSYVYRAVPDEKDPEQATFEKVRVNPGEPGDYYTGVASEDLSIGDLVVSSPDMVSEGDTAPYFVSDGKDFTEEETE
ncbi:MAG: efflux RND transporter periplasmic adaptor subunit [Ruminococcaceae bacterium]|nr:efflux RND transporter periplasmic adaptor subunit [Oscillospiraceae bacterium]